jgi:C4-dicarboxylate transporter DctQ subunit
MKIINYLNAIFDGTVNALAIFAGVLLVLIMLAISMDVIMRYFLNQPQYWVGELSEYALLYITFTGAAWVLKNDGHVKIDILTNLLNVRKQRILNFFAGIICIFVCSVITYYGVKVSWDHFERGVYNPTLMSFPKAPLLGIIPLGTFLLLIQLIKIIGKIIKSVTDCELR